MHLLSLLGDAAVLLLLLLLDLIVRLRSLIGRRWGCGRGGLDLVSTLWAVEPIVIVVVFVVLVGLFTRVVLGFTRGVCG